MTFFLAGGYSRDGGGEAEGVGLVGDDGYLGVVSVAPSPSWIAVRGDRLYAVGEGDNTVRSWRFDGSGLDEGVQVAASGEIPCHLSVLSDALLVSCYGDGVLTRVPLDEDGSLAGDGEVVLRPEGSGPHDDQPHPRVHATLVRPDGAVLVADLGSDAVHLIDTDGAVASWAVPAGTGPRDLALLPDGRTLVLGELSCTLVVLDADGRVLHEVALPGAVEGDHAAGLALAPRESGVRVYTGIRGSNLVSVVDVGADAPTPVASAETGGDWPRHLVVDDDVVRVANQLSSTVTVLDAETLERRDAPQAVPSPSQLLAVPDAWVALVR